MVVDSLVEKWSRIALNTAPAERGAAQIAMGRIYAILGFAQPRFIWAESPLSARCMEAMLVGAGILVLGDRMDWSIRSRIGREDRHSLTGEFNGFRDWTVEARVAGRQSHAVEDELNLVFWRADKLGGGPRRPMLYPPADLPANCVMEAAATLTQLFPEAEFGTQKEAVRRLVYEQVQQRGYHGMIQGFSKYITPQYGAWFDLLATTCGDEDDIANLPALLEVARCAGFVLPYREICFMCDRPATIHVDDRGRLHNADGPALEYRDGWKLYVIHGISVAPDVVLRPERITRDIIDTEQNTELRRVLMEKYGIEKYLLESGAKLTHTDEYGTLYQLERDDEETIVMVRVENQTAEPDGSRKVYFLRVPPSVETAREAVAWTFGLSAAEYAPTKQT